jgi:1-aminocyclopropane-1-carboxylate deaminase/D-cysteine desulfhydrase-like pyridoxal-dependent ACC family enzyme
VTIEDAWIGDGYGRRSADAEAAARLIARTEGIIVDPIYTAKAMAGTLALIARGAIGSGGPVVFWHAGGTLGVLEPLVGED